MLIRGRLLVPEEDDLAILFETSSGRSDRLIVAHNPLRIVLGATEGNRDTVAADVRSERTSTEQQIFARRALARLEHGAADLVSDPGEYDAALEARRREELEERALEEARLTDSGVRGVPADQR